MGCYHHCRHLTDDQAFPLDLPSRPQLSRAGAYSAAERYSPWEVASFVEYAASLGVEVGDLILLAICVPKLDHPHPDGVLRGPFPDHI